MASICRLCATLRKIETFVNIHDASLDICMKLEKCCQLLVPRTNDALPQNVCNECVIVLNDCWKFFQKVHESQESLSKIFYISDSQINSSNQNNNQSHNNAISSTISSPGNVHSDNNNDTHTMNNVQNSEVETLLHNITIIGTNNNRIPNEIVQNRSDDVSENNLKIEIAEQITFEGLDESDFAIAAGTITNAEDNHNNDISSNCHDEHEIEELQLHNLNDEINVNERSQETETNKFVDQTIDQIENQIEDEEYQEEDTDNSNNLENTDNSTSTTFLSTSLSKSMLMESLNEEDLETLGSWNDYIWKCAYCPDFVTENVYNHRFHSFTEHSDKLVKYVCTDCLKTFDRYYTFINHVKTRHRVQLQLCCDICSEFCDSASILSEHRSTAHLEELNVEFNRFGKPKKSNDDLAYCPICAKAFKNKPALAVHLKGHQPSDQKYKFPCDFCDKIFATKANWKAHHKIHVGLKDYVCALCGKGFVQKANLDEHMLTHTEDKPFECEECHRNNLGSTSSDKLKCTCTEAIPLLFNGKYFSITQKLSESEHQKSANGILAKCQLCVNEKTIKGSIRVTSNFLAHLKKKHKLQYAQYEIDKQKKKKQKTSHDSPISLTDFLNTKHYSMLQSIKKYLQNTNYVCTTADIWSGGKRSFFGYTCHWIDDSFTRKSVALACRRFPRTHRFERIGDLIHSLNLIFDLNEEKIVCTMTDNCNDLYKAFKEFGIKRQYKIKDDDELGSDSDEDEEFSMENFSPAVSKHVICGSHTLNLLATTDFRNCLKQNEVSYERHKCSLARCAAIWNKYNRPKSAEIIKNKLSCSLKTPVATRWISLYDAINHLLGHKSKLNELCKDLNLHSFNLEDFAYLEEYCIFMQPIAEGIEFLQKEQNSYFGYLLPTLITIKKKMEKVKNSGNLKCLLDISENMQATLVSRFETYFKGYAGSFDAIMASVTCPDIKTKFIPVLAETASNVSENFVKDIFLKKVKKFDKAKKITETRISEQNVPTFFDFGDRIDENPHSIFKNELNQYLEDTSYTLSSLERYPTIKKMFIYFNTPLPSSAPVERLFSFNGIVNDHSKQKLTDDHFEKLLMARANKRFKTSERLAKHISVHSDIRPHKCTICGSSFREKDTLRVHTRIHTGEMPYACDFCGKRFRFRSVLKTHRHQHTGERPYSCLECNHHFTNWPNYNKHMKRRHGVNASNGQANSNVNMNIDESDVTASVTTSSPHLSSATTTISNHLVTIRNKRQIESRATASTLVQQAKESINNHTNDRRVSSSSSLSLSKMSSLSSSNNRTGIVNQTSGTVTITQISELSTV